MPTLARGVIRRRRWIEELAQRFLLDRHAVRLMQKLRRKYGPGAIRLAIPFRPYVVLLDASDVEAALEQTPFPYATDTWEKRSALSHFEPGNVLIAEPTRRGDLRHFHEKALATDRRLHPLSQRFHNIVCEEIAAILDCQKTGLFGCLNWPAFSTAWFRVVRRVVMGDGARDDEAITGMLNRLRWKANWGFLLPNSDRKLLEFQRHLRAYLDRAEQGSLASMAAGVAVVDRESQVAQWMFAFDAAGIATYRALALLAAHPASLRAVRQEALDGGLDRPVARACVMESLRLWPTTPMILRETRTDLVAEGAASKASTILIFAPFFHRDAERLEYADRMYMPIWTREDALPAKGLVPFSAGPAICPAHNLAPLIGSFTLGAIAGRMAIRLVSPKLDPNRLPGTLNHFGLKFEMNHLPGGQAVL